MPSEGNHFFVESQLKNELFINPGPQDSAQHTSTVGLPAELSLFDVEALDESAAKIKALMG